MRLYGFGAAARIAIQTARFQGQQVFAFTRAEDIQGQQFARDLRGVWTGSSTETPPERLDAAIVFAADGTLVSAALKAVAFGNMVVCGGIQISDTLAFPYKLLWANDCCDSLSEHLSQH